MPVTIEITRTYVTADVAPVVNRAIIRRGMTAETFFAALGWRNQGGHWFREGSNHLGEWFETARVVPSGK